MRPIALALGLWALAVATGCDELGNPPIIVATTPPVQWSGGPLTTLTQAQVTAPDRWRILVRETSSQLDHMDSYVGPSDVVVLVTVQPRWRQPVVPAVVPIMTVFVLPDGSTIRRAWQAPGGASVWQAGFALPKAPKAAQTVLR